MAALASPPFSYLDTLIAVDDAIDANALLTKSILSSGLSSFNLPHEFPCLGLSGHKHATDWRGTATSNDMDKAQTIVRQTYRDWSAEGAAERETSNGVILRDLDAAFPVRHGSLATNAALDTMPDSHKMIDKNEIKILVPGAGLGRLTLDICAAGFWVEGNEISYHALLASQYILNYIPADQTFNLYPFATQFSNRVSRKDQLRCVKIPDVHPGTILREASQHQRIHAFDRMSMTASDFILLYNGLEKQDMFDAVCTVFFIDTAPNLLRYIETVRNCLKSGGLWMNIGPLLWHFRPSAHIRAEGSSSSSRYSHHYCQVQHQQTSPADDHSSNNSNSNDSQLKMNQGAEVRSETQKTDQDDDETMLNDEENPPQTQPPRRLESTLPDHGVAEPGCIELTNEEVLALIEKSGFRIEKSEILPSSSVAPDYPPQQPQQQHDQLQQPHQHGSGSGNENRGNRGMSGYIHDATSMYQQTFRLAHWIARKV